MPTITIEKKLYQQIEQAAQEEAADTNALLEKAVRQYLWEQNRRKISEEIKSTGSSILTLKNDF